MFKNTKILKIYFTWNIFKLVMIEMGANLAGDEVAGASSTVDIAYCVAPTTTTNQPTTRRGLPLICNHAPPLYYHRELSAHNR